MQKNNITLIEVPQIPDYLHISKVQTYILKHCMKRGIEIPKDAEQIKVKLQKAYSPSAREKMQQIYEIAFGHGGICLSPTYVGNQVKLRFRCENGHEWETLPTVTLKGHWCRKCGASKRGFVRRLTINEMNQLAKERGGRCLSQEYVNANVHLLWECISGHQWMAIPNSIKRGSWCPVCWKDSRLSQEKQAIKV